MDWSSGKWVPGPNVFFVVCCNFLLNDSLNWVIDYSYWTCINPCKCMHLHYMQTHAICKCEHMRCRCAFALAGRHWPSIYSWTTSGVVLPHSYHHFCLSIIFSGFLPRSLHMADSQQLDWFCGNHNIQFWTIAPWAIFAAAAGGIHSGCQSFTQRSMWTVRKCSVSWLPFVANAVITSPRIWSTSLNYVKYMQIICANSFVYSSGYCRRWHSHMQV